MAGGNQSTLFRNGVILIGGLGGRLILPAPNASCISSGQDLAQCSGWRRHVAVNWTYLQSTVKSCDHTVRNMIRHTSLCVFPVWQQACVQILYRLLETLLVFSHALPSATSELP